MFKTHLDNWFARFLETIIFFLFDQGAKKWTRKPNAKIYGGS